MIKIVSSEGLPTLDVQPAFIAALSCCDEWLKRAFMAFIDTIFDTDEPGQYNPKDKEYS